MSNSSFPHRGNSNCTSRSIEPSSATGSFLGATNRVWPAFSNAAFLHHLHALSALEAGREDPIGSQSMCVLKDLLDGRGDAASSDCGRMFGERDDFRERRFGGSVRCREEESAAGGELRFTTSRYE